MLTFGYYLRIFRPRMRLDLMHCRISLSYTLSFEQMNYNDGDDGVGGDDCRRI